MIFGMRGTMATNYRTLRSSNAFFALGNTVYSEASRVPTMPHLVTLREHPIGCYESALISPSRGTVTSSRGTVEHETHASETSLNQHSRY